MRNEKVKTRIKCKWLLLDPWADEYEAGRRVLFERRFTIYYRTTGWCLRNYSSTVWRRTRGQKGGQRRLFKIFAEMFSTRTSALLSTRFNQYKSEFITSRFSLQQLMIIDNFILKFFEKLFKRKPFYIHLNPFFL